MAKFLDTNAMAHKLRSAGVDKAGKRLLITNFHGTEQERDLTEPANCRGLGRVRHFKRTRNPVWVPDPLPIDPACKALGITPRDEMRAQVFQCSICDWRCWYCFVDFELLSASKKHSEWVSPSQLIDLYFSEPHRPLIIDLSGGQPDLIPEWVLWMMEELVRRRVEKDVYLWSDDNLSGDYFWNYLSEDDRESIVSYEKYGRVGCFKGFNADSFSFNTQAPPDLYARQFDLFGRLLGLGIDVYAYATFPSPQAAGIRGDMCEFVDRLQALDENLPLRTVPLEIDVFTPVQGRMNELRKRALRNQYVAIEAWKEELATRFTEDARARCIADVPLADGDAHRIKSR